MGRLLSLFLATALVLGGCATAPEAPPVVEATAPLPKAAAEVDFQGEPPGVIAQRLASECTRLRMAVIRNTPERVVCKRTSADATELVAQPVAELWSFFLTDTGQQATKVEARPSVEGVAAGGYAVLSFAESDDPTMMAMRAFLEGVRDSGGLRGPLPPDRPRQ